MWKIPSHLLPFTPKKCVYGCVYIYTKPCKIFLRVCTVVWQTSKNSLLFFGKLPYQECIKIFLTDWWHKFGIIFICTFVWITFLVSLLFVQFFMKEVHLQFHSLFDLYSLDLNDFYLLFWFFFILWNDTTTIFIYLWTHLYLWKIYIYIEKEKKYKERLFLCVILASDVLVYLWLSALKCKWWMKAIFF